MSGGLTLGLTLCAVCRIRDAEVTESAGERWQRHLCARCADEHVERLCVPAGQEALFASRDDLPWRPLPAPRVRLEDADHTKLIALRQQWLAFSARATDTARCWAMLGDGSRCVRAAEEDGVCGTHAFMGCRLPGLGWRGTEPQGRVVNRARKKGVAA